MSKIKKIVWTAMIKILYIILIGAIVFYLYLLNIPPPRPSYNHEVSEELKREMRKRGPNYCYIEDENGRVFYKTEKGICRIK